MASPYVDFLLTSPLAALVLLCVVLLFHRERSFRQRLASLGLRSLPGPARWPVIGSILTLAKYPKPWLAFSDLRSIYGDVFGMKLGNESCVIVSGGDVIREVLVRRAEDFAHRPDFLRFSAIFRGDRHRSVALCDWSEKQRRRRALAFPYTHPRLSSYDRLGSSIVTELQHLIKILQSSEGGQQHVHRHVLHTCANIFYQFFCSRRFDYDDQDFARTVSNYYTVFRQLFIGFPIDFFPWIRYFGGWKTLSKLHEISCEISHFTRPLFKDRLSREVDPNSRDLIDILVESVEGEENVLDDEEALVVIEDLVGGHVALHNMCMWALGFLVGREDIQQRIASEAGSVLGPRDALALGDRPRLPYTEATVLEVLRLVVSPIIPHRATKDSAINGYFIEKDSLIMFNTYDLHLDSSLWKNPLDFNPERFLSADGRVTKPDHFIPFSSGRRACLGDCISRSTLLLTLAMLVRLFHVTLAPGSQPIPSLAEIPGSLLWPEHVHIEFIPREK